ncbi:MAG: potassium channel family protein [Breznakibacter sp.]
MKYIVIGLGNFGVSLAKQLAQNGHEVIGVDNSDLKVEEYKDAMTTTICLNSVEETALRSLPLNEVDAVVVAIGEDLAASVQTIALLKKIGVQRIIGRALSPLHETIIEAIGIADILNPEREAARNMVGRLESVLVADQFAISDDYSLMEIRVSGILVKQTIEQVGFEQNFNLKLLSVKRELETRNFIGITKREMRVMDTFSGQTLLLSGDQVVLFGRISDFQRFLKICKRH